MGWRWHFRMSKTGQRLLKLAHRDKTPVWLHDRIERLVYGKTLCPVCNGRCRDQGNERATDKGFGRVRCLRNLQH